MAGCCAGAASGHAAEQRDEVAAPDANCHLIRPAERGGAAPTIAQSVAAFPKTTEGLSVSIPVAYLGHLLQRTVPAGFIAPCLPIKTTTLPPGGQWLHEIKHDGFRVVARKEGDRVRLCSRLRDRAVEIKSQS